MAPINNRYSSTMTGYFREVGARPNEAKQMRYEDIEPGTMFFTKADGLCLRVHQTTEDGPNVIKVTGGAACVRTGTVSVEIVERVNLVPKVAT